MRELNSIEKKTLELMIEFRDICNKNNLKFFLGPRIVATLNCFGGFGGEYHIPDVLMPIDDAMAFIRIIETEGGEDRAMDYMGNNNNYANFSACYVNEQTTFIDIRQGDNYSRYGVKIRIDFLRPKINSLLASLLETGWESTGYRMLKKQDFKMNASKNVVKVYRKLSGSKAAERMFRFFAKQYCRKNSSNSTLFIKRMKSKKVYYSEELFDSVEYVNFEDEEFPAPSDQATYIENILGKHWKHNIENGSRKMDIIFAYNIPYRKVITTYEKSGRKLSDIFERNRDSLYYTFENREQFEVKNNAWLIALRSGERLKGYEELMPQWDKICRLREERNYDELYEIFRNYDQKTKMFLNSDIGLCASKEILDIECELLKHNGEFEKARKLLNLAPKEHYVPLGKGVKEKTDEIQ